MADMRAFDKALDDALDARIQTGGATDSLTATTNEQRVNDELQMLRFQLRELRAQQKEDYARAERWQAEAERLRAMILDAAVAKATPRE